ncbi:hypothetical protein ZWY2020_009642 [Hordeum vulgare]|nr:hypothetical protein ZWY2020_009642 [Hordeum vulgare]
MGVGCPGSCRWPRATREPGRVPVRRSDEAGVPFARVGRDRNARPVQSPSVALRPLWRGTGPREREPSMWPFGPQPSSPNPSDTGSPLVPLPDPSSSLRRSLVPSSIPVPVPIPRASSPRPIPLLPYHVAAPAPFSPATSPAWPRHGLSSLSPRCPAEPRCPAPVQCPPMLPLPPPLWPRLGWPRARQPCPRCRCEEVLCAGPSGRLLPRAPRCRLPASHAVARLQARARRACCRSASPPFALAPTSSSSQLAPPQLVASTSAIAPASLALRDPCAPPPAALQASPPPAAADICRVLLPLDARRSTSCCLLQLLLAVVCRRVAPIG